MRAGRIEGDTARVASLENKPKGGRADDIEAARERAEDASEEEGGGQQIQFEEGFTGKVMVGTLFVCLIMLPGAIYLGLVAGQSLGSAAQWVTIVLFSEIARRSFLPLKRQEIYCLFYMAGALASTGFGALPGVSGGPFGGFIALSYLMQSPAMHNVAPLLPHWIAPPLGSPAYMHRNVLDPAWYLPVFWSPVSVLLFTQVFDRMKWMGLGYLLFRVTSDIERLPFPLAPIAASGATALAEASTKEKSWRWRVFSTGTIIGLLFGFFYLAIPIFTGVALGKPLQLLPIPFLDLTPSTERILPTALLGYNPDLGALMVGFLLPFPIVLGGFLSSIIAQIGLNPILYHAGACSRTTSAGRPPSRPRPRLTSTSGCRSASVPSSPSPPLAWSPLAARCCGGAVRSASPAGQSGAGAGGPGRLPLAGGPGGLVSGEPRLHHRSTTASCRRSPSGSSSFTPCSGRR